MEKNYSRKAIILLLMKIIQCINANIDYCIGNPNHLLCNIDCSKYTRVGHKECKNYKEVTFTDEEGMKEEVIQKHNKVRTEVNSGEIEIAQNIKFPIAKEMKSLKWDNLLYCTAKIRADRCTTTVTNSKFRTINGKAIGEVIYILADYGPVLSQNHFVWDTIIYHLNYGNVRLYFPLESIKKFDPIGLEGKSVANLGQLISSKIHLVGCATSSYKSENSSGKNDLLFVCHYGPEGLMKNEIVYEEKQDNDQLCANETSPKTLCKSGENYALDLYPKKPETTTPTPGSYSAPKNKGTGFLFIGVLLKAFFAI